LTPADPASPTTPADCKFVGGRYAFSLGLTTGTMSDITLMVDSEFRDAVVGFTNGSFNALD